MKHQAQQETKERNDFEKLLQQQSNILDKYVEAFAESVGRKPLPDEIVLNMKDDVDTRVLENYLTTYNYEDLSMV